MKNVSDIYPLSPMQELMLVFALSQPDSDLLLNQVVFTLEGDVDVFVLEQCWKDAVDYHPMLRTLFLWDGLKEPVQVVRETVELDWQYHEWDDTTSEEQQNRLAKLLQKDRARGFDLSKAPLMRFNLCHLGNRRYTLVWNSHHLIGDRWCIGILVQEISKRYDAYQAGIKVQLETTRPFRDYIRWLKQQDIQAAQEFWRKELVGRGLLPRGKRLSMKAASLLFRHPRLFALAGRLGRTALRWLPRWATHNRFNTWTVARELPEPPKESFRDWYRRNRQT